MGIKAIALIAPLLLTGCEFAENSPAGEAFADALIEHQLKRPDGSSPFSSEAQSGFKECARQKITDASSNLSDADKSAILAGLPGPNNDWEPLSEDLQGKYAPIATVLSDCQISLASVNGDGRIAGVRNDSDGDMVSTTSIPASSPDAGRDTVASTQEIEELITRQQYAAAACRAGEGGANQCALADNLYNDLMAKGYCFGEDPDIQFARFGELVWLPCKNR